MSEGADLLTRARALLTGEGASQDVRAGMALLEQAAAADHAPALLLLSDVYEQGLDPVPANRRLAFAYLDRAVELGDGEAMLRLASWYRQGLGVAVSLEQAFALNQAAARLDGITAATAHFNLGVAFEHGQGVTADWAQAHQHYGVAAQAGLAQAQHNLGACLFHGRGVAPDKAQALSWYAVAAAQGLALSQFALGCMYLDGDGVNADPVTALSWLLMSAAQDHAPSMLLVKRLASTLPDEDVAQAGRLAEQFPAQFRSQFQAPRQTGTGPTH